MRQRRLKKLWQRLHELRGQSLKRDELLLKLGAARKERGPRVVPGRCPLAPPAREAVTPETFTFQLRRERLRCARRREGRYLLCSNLTGEDPANCGAIYLQLTEPDRSFAPNSKALTTKTSRLGGVMIWAWSRSRTGAATIAAAPGGQ